MTTDPTTEAETQDWPPLRRNGAGRQSVRILLWVLRAVVFSAKVLVLAFFASLLAGPLGFLLPGVSEESLQGYAWAGGAAVSIIGIRAGWVKFGREVEAPGTLQPVEAEVIEPAGLRRRIIGGAMVGGVIAMLGACLILVCWLSLGRCPFLPPSWHETLSLSSLPITSPWGSGIRFNGGGTWMAVLFIFGTTFFGAVAGAIGFAFLKGHVTWHTLPPGSVRRPLDPFRHLD